MKSVVVDTNLLISFLTDRDAEQQTRAAELFQASGRGEARLILHQAVISELVYVLGNLYRVPSEEIAATIDDLLRTPGVCPVDEVSWPRVLELWPQRCKDFGDAVLATVAAEGRHDAVATFDQRFTRQLRKQGLSAWLPEPEQTEEAVPEGDRGKAG